MGPPHPSLAFTHEAHNVRREANCCYCCAAAHWAAATHDPLLQAGGARPPTSHAVVATALPRARAERGCLPAGVACGEWIHPVERSRRARSTRTVWRWGGRGRALHQYRCIESNAMLEVGSAHTAATAPASSRAPAPEGGRGCGTAPAARGVGWVGCASLAGGGMAAGQRS